MSDQTRQNAADLVAAVKRWRSEIPTDEARTAEVCNALMRINGMHQQLMNEWAEQPFFSAESDRLQDRIDELQSETMAWLPYVIKLLNTPARQPDASEGGAEHE